MTQNRLEQSFLVQGREFRGEHAPELRALYAYDFLERCRIWAEQTELPKRIDALTNDLTREKAVNVQSWIVFRDFIEHAMKELEQGELDHWFEQRVIAQSKATKEETK